MTTTVQPYSPTNPYSYPGDRPATRDAQHTLPPAARLRNILRNNMRERDAHRPELYVLNRHVSRSGMLRRVSVFVVNGGELVDVTRLVADVTGFKLSRNYTTNADTLALQGAGMDMHFHLTYTLGRKLYPAGDTRPGATHTDAGYMIRKATI